MVILFYICGKNCDLFYILVCSWPFLHLSLIFTYVTNFFTYYVGGFTFVGIFTIDGLTVVRLLTNRCGPGSICGGRLRRHAQPLVM